MTTVAYSFLSGILFLIWSVIWQFYSVEGHWGKSHYHFNQPCNASKFDKNTTNWQAWKSQLIICKLLAGYEKAVRPRGIETPQDPIHVHTSLRIRTISAVSDSDMEFSAQFRFRQKWFDKRLQFAAIAGYRSFDRVLLAHDQRVWIPDTFFQNEKDGWYHFIDQPNTYTAIRSDGLVFYDRRLSLTLACNIDLIRYPMDTQKCLIDFASYAYTTKDIIYEWDIEPVLTDPGINGVLPNFVILSVTNSSCDSITNTGTYSCLRVVIRLQRVFSFFLLQLYVPSSMLVAVSWVSYWIDWKSTAARVPLAIVTLLTMITQSHSINSNLPPVSYTKAIDVWIGACVVFIFASLIEYAVVNYTGLQEEYRNMRRMADTRHRMSCAIYGSISGMLFDGPALAFQPPTTNALTQLAAVAEEEQQWETTAGSTPSSPPYIDCSVDDVSDDERTPPQDRSPAIGLHTERKTLLRHRSGSNRSWKMNNDSNSRPPRKSRLSFANVDEKEENKEHRSAPWSPGYEQQGDLSANDEERRRLPPIRLTHRRTAELVRWCSMLHARSRAERIDIVARILQPIAFLLFNCVYWTVYLSETTVN